MIGRRFCVLCSKTAQSITFYKELYSTAPKLTNAEVRKKRNEIFNEEKKKQKSRFVKRIEKIMIEVETPKENVQLMMNKHISTPYNCAMHCSEMLMKRSVLAVVNDEPWDMHRPLEEDCKLNFKLMTDNDPQLVNEAFWRTGGFVLGHILETAFKDNIYVELKSSPSTPVSSGSFVHDVDLKLPKWQPTQMELQSLSILAGQLAGQDLDFERLEVKADVAIQMFKDNKFKSRAIQELAETDQYLRVYRMGEHIDLCDGPLIGNISQFFRFNVTAIHQIEDGEFGPLQRVQAVALPQDLRMHWWTWDLLCRRATKLNPVNLVDGKLVPEMRVVQEEVDKFEIEEGTVKQP